MKRKKITKWIPLLLFVLLFGIVDFLLKGYCIENAWNIGRKKTTLYDRYYEYSEDGNKLVYSCLKKTELSQPFFQTEDTYILVSLIIDLEAARKEMIPVILERENWSSAYRQTKSKDRTKTANFYELAELVRDGDHVLKSSLSAESGIRSGDTVRLRLPIEEWPISEEPCLLELGYPKMDNLLTTGHDYGEYVCLAFPQPETVNGDQCDMLVYPRASVFDEKVQKDIIAENHRFHDEFKKQSHAACILMTPLAVIGDLVMLPYYIVHIFLSAISGGHPPF